MKLYEYYLLKKGLKDLLAVYWWRKKTLSRMVREKYFSYWGIVPKGRCKGLMTVVEEPAGAERIPLLKEELRTDVVFWLGLPSSIVAAGTAIVFLLRFFLG